MSKLSIGTLRTWKALADDIDTLQDRKATPSKDLKEVVALLEGGAVEEYTKGKKATLQAEAEAIKADVLECFKFELEDRDGEDKQAKETKADKETKPKASKKLHKKAKGAKSTKAKETEEEPPEEQEEPKTTTLKANAVLTFTEREKKGDAVREFRVVAVEANRTLLQNTENFNDAFVAEVDEQNGIYILKDVGSNWQTVATLK